MKSHFKKITTLCMALLLMFCSICNVSAAEETTGPQIQMTACEGYSSSIITFTAILTDDSDYWGYYAVYRGTQDPATGGNLTLYDTFSNSWWGDTSGNIYSKGNKGKVICYTKQTSFDGEAVFYDTNAKLGTTYYYQVVMLNSDTDKVMSGSNVMSAHTSLDTPDIIRIYAKTNKSVSLNWTKASKAKGYEIYRKSGSSWKKVKTIKKASKTSWTDKKVKSGKTYLYRIRAYTYNNGQKIYSDYGYICKAKTKNPTVKGTYTKGSVYGPYLSTDELADVKRVVQGFKDNFISKKMSDYEKVLVAFNFIRANCDYATKGWQYNGANTAWGALVYGEAQCSGYARGMKALCDAIGVPCRYVHANSKSINPNHQWNQVKIGGKWYILDAQGGFFLVGSSTYKSTGMKWSTKGLPKCSKKDHAKGGFVSSEM